MSYGTDINDLADEIHKIAKDHGFWDDVISGDNIPTKLMLIVTEVAEAMEHYRNGTPVAEQWVHGTGKPDGFVIELADIIIRVLDLAGRYDLNIQQAIWDKVAYNRSRPIKHGKIV